MYYKIIEFVTKYGVTYIAKLLSENSDSYCFKDVMTISMRPIPKKDKDNKIKYDMVPSLDIITVFTNNNFTFYKSDIVSFGEIEVENFIKLYEDSLFLYNNERDKFITKENIDYNVEKKK